MRIALLTTDYLPNIGGVAQHIYELARAHAIAGHDVEVIAPDESSKWGNLRARPYAEHVRGISVWRIPTTLNRSIPALTGKLSFAMSASKFCSETQARLADFRPDILHWHAINGRMLPAASARAIPRVWTNHTSDFIDGMAVPKLRDHYLREASCADEIIAPSEELRDLTVKLGIPAERVTFITNGVDSTRFHPDTPLGIWPERIPLTEGHRLVLCPRRLEKKNGVRYFVEAALHLLRQGMRGVTFAVAGNYVGPSRDSDEADVRAMIASARAEAAVKLLGRVENADMPSLYASASLVVMPSLIEATSLSAMEAMATGKPIVSTNVGGLPFLIRDSENGLLVPPRDAAALANGIRAILDDPSRARRMGEAGRRRVESELDWVAVASQTRAIYERAISAHSGRTSPH